MGGRGVAVRGGSAGGAAGVVAAVAAMAAAMAVVVVLMRAMVTRGSGLAGPEVVEVEVEAESAKQQQQQQQQQQQRWDVADVVLTSPSPTATSPHRTAAVDGDDDDESENLARASRSIYAAQMERIRTYAEEHVRDGAPHAVGLRGVSWVHANLNGTVLGSPRLALLFAKAKTKTTTTTTSTTAQSPIPVEITDVSPGRRCDPALANAISIWLRAAGPDIVATQMHPVPGECKWRADVRLYAPGNYTFLARLMTFNGGVEHNDRCDVVPTEKASSLKLEMLAEVPLYPYWGPDDECCPICARFPGAACRYSFLTEVRPTDKFRGSGWNKCVLMRAVSSPSPTSTTADAIRNATGVDAKTPLRFTPLRTDVPLGRHMWQLGCGRDEMLTRWATCQSAGGPPGMTGNEDSVIMEHEHRALPVSVSPAAGIVTPETAWRDVVGGFAVQAQKNKQSKPICEWQRLPGGVLGLPHFSQGRWVRLPPSKLEACGPLPYFEALDGYHVSPPYPRPRNPETETDPLCWHRYDLPFLTKKGLRWPPPSSRDAYLRSWKSELSDTYDRSKGEFPFVGREPFAGHWVLPPTSECRMPPPRLASEVRECLASRRIEAIHFDGASVMEIQKRVLFALLRGAFPEDSAELGKVMDAGSVGEATTYRFNYTNTGSGRPVRGFEASTPRREVGMTNLASPHAVTMHLVSEMRSRIEAKWFDKPWDMFVYVLPPWMPSERRNYMTPERTLQMRDAMRAAFSKRGWYELDYTSLTMAWSFDTSPDLDGFHHLGPAPSAAAQLIVDLLCRAPFLRSV